MKHPDRLSRVDINEHDDTDIDEEITVLDLINSTRKRLTRLSKTTRILNSLLHIFMLNKNKDPVSRKTFLREQARDPNCQNYASLVLEGWFQYKLRYRSITIAYRTSRWNSPEHRIDYYSQTTIIHGLLTLVTRTHRCDQNVSLITAQILFAFHGQASLRHSMRLPILRKS